MQDLLRAAQKALASGLGDWHLQALQDISPLFQEHVLMGALGPETLKHKHKLPEQQILQLYGLLHRHSTGFQQEVQDALAGAAHTEQLLASIWTAFAQLWDECVQVSFQGEVLAAMQELQATYAALLDTQDALTATQQENAALTGRCNEFVKANLDHMLAWRALKTKADALEGEVAMLGSANSEVSLRAAAIQARNTQLTVQLEGLGARMASAEQQIKERESALAAARVALLEKDSGFCRLEAQVAALEQQLLAAGHAAKRQEGNCGELQRELKGKEQLVQDADLRVADKQRAYNLLHADFVKQKATAAEAEQRAADTEKRLEAVQQQLAGMQSFVAKAEGWRRRWEVCQMEVEDLMAADARATMRRQELVSSYWPVMERLGAAEDVVAALTQQEEYWRQKDRLMALEIEAGQLRVSTEQAQATAAQASSTLFKAQAEAAKHASQCSKLEADIVGYKSWVRELEKTEQAYLKAIREQGSLEDAATAAQRQLEDCRLALSAAESNCHLAQAAAEAVSKERKQLMSQLTQEMNKSTIFEEVVGVWGAIEA
ncbi:hypothetical protein OEZ86_001779 [Tetradesmus obliquus]|nr:hypothetical protein OEZ86_001779 [Tetradesmus obliquus]